MNTKQHIMTIHNFDAGRSFTFMVTGRTDPDGKTRISWAAFNEAMRRAGATRGHCIKVG